MTTTQQQEARVLSVHDVIDFPAFASFPLDGDIALL